MQTIEICYSTERKKGFTLNKLPKFTIHTTLFHFHAQTHKNEGYIKLNFVDF